MQLPDMLNSEQAIPAYIYPAAEDIAAIIGNMIAMTGATVIINAAMIAGLATMANIIIVAVYVRPVKHCARLAGWVFAMHISRE